ncbi:hypothetical protein H8E88_35975, partial [candidate division KSB1 bacterium]|nr:hypothetical protein [candidate division KSB1 bacterium]
KNSPTENALRKLATKFFKVELNENLKKQIESLDVLILDRRLVTLKPQILDFKSDLEKFVNRGGHLIVLAQDAVSWNNNPLWEGIKLKSTILLDETYPVQANPEHKLLTSPNLITVEDWRGWLFRRAFNIVSAKELTQAQLPLKTEQLNTPLIVTFKEGKGNKTYIDLALGHQFMNINPGAFRLLANLISY